MKKALLLLSVVVALTGMAAPKDNFNFDIRPDAPVNSAPTAVEWQNRNAEALNKALQPKVLATFVASPEAADALLAKVKKAYASDPTVLTQIAAVTQLVMTPDCDKAEDARELWSEALLRAAASSTDGYRTTFFLDQLRWCAEEDQADEIAAIGKKSNDKAVQQMAAMVAREVDDDDDGIFSFFTALWD